MHERTSMEKKDYNKIYKQKQQDMAVRINELTRKEQAWFWDLTRAQLKWYIYKFTQDQEDIFEVLALSLNKIILGIDKYDPSKALFTSWCHRIAHNEALAYLHYKWKDKNRSLYLDKDDEFFELTADEVEDPERIDYLHKLILKEIETLSPDMKVVAVRYLIEGEKQHILAEELGINLNTLKTRVKILKKKISTKILKSHSDLVY